MEPAVRIPNMQRGKTTSVNFRLAHYTGIKTIPGENVLDVNVLLYSYDR